MLNFRVSPLSTQSLSFLERATACLSDHDRGSRGVLLATLWAPEDASRLLLSILAEVTHCQRWRESCVELDPHGPLRNTGPGPLMSSFYLFRSKIDINLKSTVLTIFKGTIWWH